MAGDSGADGGGLTPVGGGGGRGGSKAGRMVRVISYTMLAASAAVAVVSGDRLWLAWHEGRLPVWAPLLPPVTFVAFVGVFAVDRWLLVRRRRDSAPRAMFQLLCALVFLTLLLPRSAAELRQGRRVEVAGAPEAALALLAHPEAAVRAAACNLVAGRFPPRVYDRVEQLAHHDADAAVRAHCVQALERLHAAAVSL